LRRLYHAPRALCVGLNVHYRASVRNYGRAPNAPFPVRDRNLVPLFKTGRLQDAAVPLFTESAPRWPLFRSFDFFFGFAGWRFAATFRRVFRVGRFRLNSLFDFRGFYLSGLGLWFGHI